MSPDAKDDNRDKQDNREKEPSLLQVNALPFIQVASGDDYTLYQTRKQRQIGDIEVDIFLEHVLDKGWWGAIRLNGRFRIQLKLDHKTLFPTPEIALQATEEFLANEQQVREILQEMRTHTLDLQTFQHVPLRPTNVDPEKYFSPALFNVHGNIYTLYHLTKTEAAYRSWEQKQVAEITVDLRLTHIYWKGWQAGLWFSDSHLVLFEPALDQFFLTPEKALETLLAFCSEEESVRNLAQRLKGTRPQDQIIIRNEIAPLIPAKQALRVNNLDFVWQKQMSEGNLYQAKRAQFIHFTKVHIQLIETWRKGWLGGVQLKDISGVFFEKESDVGFPTPKEALDTTHTFLSLQEKGLRTLRSVHAERGSLQCKTGRYDQMMSIRIAENLHTNSL